MRARPSTSARATSRVPIELKQIVAASRRASAPDFDVVLETDHLHIEFEPKQSVTNG